MRSICGRPAADLGLRAPWYAERTLLAPCRVLLLTLAALFALTACGARTHLIVDDPDDATTDGRLINCPNALPAEGVACNTTDLCTYPSACGGRDTAACLGGRWNVTRVRCGECPPTPPVSGSRCDPASRVECHYPPPVGCTGDVRASCVSARWTVESPTCARCPTAPPAAGTSCPATGLSCAYPNDCGGTFQLNCTPSLRWIRSDPTACPCPPTRPKFESKCPTEGMSCAWKNDCGAEDTGKCVGGVWKIDAKPCGECPLFNPTAGTACTKSSSCRYFAGDCVQDCACTDKLWSCDTPKCGP